MKKIGTGVWVGLTLFAVFGIFAHFSSRPVFACEVETTADLSNESMDMICSRLCGDFGGWKRQPKEEPKKGPQFVKCECKKPAGFGPCPR